MLRDMDRHLALAGVLLVIVAQAVFSIWNRKIALASLLFWSALAPVSNIIPIYHPMADRYLYTPMAGVALLLAMRLSAIRQKETRVLTNTLALAAIAGLAVATLVQQSYWKDAAALWKRTAGQNPLSYNAWLGWGYACLDNNDAAQAIERFLQASEVAHGKMAEPFAGIALAEDALANRRLAGIALSRATKLDSRFARPETLVRALILPDYRAQRLALIARRASPP